MSELDNIDIELECWYITNKISSIVTNEIVV